MDDRESKKPTRERQIEVMTGAAERARAAVTRWLARPEVKESLHRRDACGQAQRPVKVG